MKFVIGLLIGTLGVLALASARDYSWEPPKRSNFTTLAASVEVEQEQEREQEREQKLKQKAGAAKNLPVELPSVNPEPIKSVTIEPLPAEPEPEKAPPPLGQAQITQSPPADETTELNLAESAPNQRVSAEDQALETAVVWKPFHSQVSADGFARRLSTQLGYPFRALREGPAKYHVVFDYGSQEQRELLRAQVEALTGFSSI